MSGFVGIATVTSALQRLLLPAARRAVPGSRVTVLRPDQIASDPQAKGVNVWMHRASPLPTTNSWDLPRRDGGGAILRKPSVALELDYLLTCLGDNASLEPQKLLGSVIVELQTHATIPAARLAQLSGTPTVPNLPAHLSRVLVGDADLHWIWALYGSPAYMPTVIYRATTVLLQADVEPEPAPPVRETRVGTSPNLPTLTAVTPRAAIGDALELSGSFPSAPTGLWFEGHAVPASSIRSASASTVVVPLTAEIVDTAKLTPGPCRVAIAFGGGPDATSTNARTFRLVPTIVALVPATNALEVTVDPPPRPGQRASLQLYSLGSGPGHEVGPILVTDPPAVSFDTSRIPAGTWLVEVRIDGVSSELATGPDGAYDAPTVRLGDSP